MIFYSKMSWKIKRYKPNNDELRYVNGYISLFIVVQKTSGHSSCHNLGPWNSYDHSSMSDQYAMFQK